MFIIYPRYVNCVFKLHMYLQKYSSSIRKQIHVQKLMFTDY